MKLSDRVREALESRNAGTLHDAAQVTGVSKEVIRLLLKDRRIPSDQVLRRMARNLGMDETAVIVAAHRERLKDTTPICTLEPKPSRYARKRVWPLSQEQCEYLETILKPVEIQLLRKYRQVTPEARLQIQGCIDFVFLQRRKEQEKELQQAIPA